MGIHPWVQYLEARKVVIDWLVGQGESEKQIARNLSLNPGQVALIAVSSSPPGCSSTDVQEVGDGWVYACERKPPTGQDALIAYACPSEEAGQFVGLQQDIGGKDGPSWEFLAGLGAYAWCPAPVPPPVHRATGMEDL